MTDHRDSKNQPTERDDARKMNRRSFIGSTLAVAGGIAASQSASAQTSEYETITVSRGDRFTTSVGDNDTFENKLIDISAPGATFRIEAHGSDWTIRNIGIKGEWDQRSDGHQQAISCRVDSGTGVIDNFYFASGCPDDVFPGVTGIYVQRSHSGTLRVNNVNIQEMPNNAIYASTFGSSNGGQGSIEITNSFAADCLASHFRIAGDGSYVDNCVAVGGDRGVWAKYGQMEVNACDLSGAATNRADGDLVCGTNSYSTDAVVEVTDTFFESCAPGHQGINYAGEIIGKSASGLRRNSPEEVEGVPLTAEEAAQGNLNSPGRGSDSAKTLTIETTDNAPLVEYEFTVDGNVAAGDAAEPSDVITTTDGTTTVTGNVGDGYSDDFAIDGELTDWSASAGSRHYRVFLDGEELDLGVSESARTLTIEMADDAPKMEYEFTVDGEVSPGDMAEDNDTIATAEGTTTVSGQASSSWSDDFEIDGELTDWSASANSRHYSLVLDGEELDPSKFESTRLLTIETTDNAPLVEYEFTVDGTVSPGASAETSDKVTTTDGTTTVTGNVGDGYSDDFVIDGELTNWSASANSRHYSLVLDGEELDPSKFESTRSLTIETTDNAPLVEYEFTVDGNVAAGDAAEPSDVITTTDGTTTVTGNVGDGYSDDFAIDGELTDWSTTAVSRHYRLLLDDEELDSAKFQSNRTLTIEMADDAPKMEYEFTVDGEVSPGDMAEDNDTIATADGTTTVSGQASSGWSDDFEIDGELTDWSATVDSSHYSLVLDGEEINP